MHVIVPFDLELSKTQMRNSIPIPYEANGAALQRFIE